MGRPLRARACPTRQERGEIIHIDVAIAGGPNCVAPVIYNEVGVTVMGRIKVTGFTGTRELMLGINADDGLQAALHWGGPDGVLEEVARDTQATIAGSSDYVIARMTAIGLSDADYACARLIRVYINENPMPALEIVAPADKSKTPEGIAFGAGSTSGTADIWFDWVSGPGVQANKDCDGE